MTQFRLDLSDVEIDDGGLDVGMAQQSLNGVDVDAIFEQMGSVAVPQGVHGDVLADLGFGQGLGNDVLNATHAHGLSGSESFEEVSARVDFTEIEG